MKMNGSSNKVYAIHEPLRYDRRSRCMVRMDLHDASAFGELRVVLPGENRPPPIERCADILREAMAGYRPCDRLIIAGNMDLLVFAAVLASKAAHGKLTLLKWNTREQVYDEISAPEGLLV